MEASLCKLTLVFPRATEVAVIEALQEPSLCLRGFTTWHAEGHGMGFESASLQEQLRGHVDRLVLVLVLRRVSVQEVLQYIRVTVPVPHVAYWIEPVEEMGVLQ